MNNENNDGILSLNSFHEDIISMFFSMTHYSPCSAKKQKPLLSLNSDECWAFSYVVVPTTVLDIHREQNVFIHSSHQVNRNV